MSLQNLLKIGQLERHETDAVQLGRLLDSSVRRVLQMQESKYLNSNPESV
jgi:hypothetical protein